MTATDAEKELVSSKGWTLIAAIDRQSARTRETSDNVVSSGPCRRARLYDIFKAKELVSSFRVSRNTVAMVEAQISISARPTSRRRLVLVFVLVMLVYSKSIHHQNNKC